MRKFLKDSIIETRCYFAKNIEKEKQTMLKSILWHSLHIGTISQISILVSSIFMYYPSRIMKIFTPEMKHTQKQKRV